MAGFDTRNALNLAIRALRDAALERAAGGYIPPKEAERQRKEQERQQIAQQRDMERQQKDQARQEEKARKEAERVAKDNGGSIGWSKKRSNAEIRSSHYEDGRSKSHVGYVNPIDFLHATTSNDDELRTIMKSAGDLNREKIEEETQSPFLIINNGKINGHEGRHRMAALAKAGYTSAPVAIHYRGNYGEFREPIDSMTFGPQYNDKRNPVTVSNMIPLHGNYADQINGMMEQHEDHFASGGQILSKQFPTQYMPNVGRQVMQDGGVPDEMAPAMPQMQPEMVPQPQMQPSRPRFAIRSEGSAPTSTGQTEDYQFAKLEQGKANTNSLGQIFDKAIQRHLSLSEGERIRNSQMASKALEPYLGKNKDGSLPAIITQNEKLAKTNKGTENEEPIKLPDGRGVETWGLSLYPDYKEGDLKLCPNSASCSDQCLGKHSGQYSEHFDIAQKNVGKVTARERALNRTKAMLREPEAFAIKMFDDIESTRQMARMNGNHLGVRVNTLSDLAPRVFKSIFENQPNVSFYDYSKMGYQPIAENHHITHSSTGLTQEGVENPYTNWNKMRRFLDGGQNVAMVFSNASKSLPEFVHDQETGKKYQVVNGVDHDFRPMEIQPEGSDGVVVGLINKKSTGKKDQAHIDSDGFFVHYDPKTMGNTVPILPQGKPKIGLMMRQKRENQND